MPATRQQLLDWIDKLEAQRMSGLRSVTDENNERVDYASDREMANAIASARRQLEQPPIKTIKFVMTKGV
jgi:hypothetical protein